MSIGDDVAAALPELRAQAESRMLDTCTITAPSAAGTTWNPTTASYDAADPVVLYDGPCQFKPPGGASSRTGGQGRLNTSGPEDVAVASVLLHLPVEGTELVGRDDQTVTCTSSPFDSSLVGRVFGVISSVQGSQQTARRIPLREVVG